MIDVRLVRTDPEGVKRALARKGVDPSDVDRLVELDGALREVAGRRDEVRGRVNAMSKEVGAARRGGDAEKAEALALESRALGDEEKRLAAEADRIERDLRDLLLVVPNLPADEALDGAGEEDNAVVRTVGFDPEAYGPHQRVPHWDTGEALGILDLPRGAKISGAMFPVLRGMGATLSRALCSWFLDVHAPDFEEVRPPTLVRTDTLVATGQLPKFADDAYQVERDDLWAIPTAEVPLTSLHRDEILEEADLPRRLMAYTPCYRREAGSAGRDTRGMLRSHEFDKVEILALSTPEQAREVHAELLARAEGLLPLLGLAYRVVEICTGDLGQSHARQFDLEVYCPGSDSWQEVSSVSWFSDYQARRANLRYRPASGGGTAHLHTLNGSALAVPRVWAAILEVHRRPDGSVAIPEVLHPYCRGATEIR